jgi:hypothetical protein
VKTKHTAVIFRTFKLEGDPIALFPFEPADCNGWHCMSFQHVGQHGGATPHLVRGRTRRATPKEKASLRASLRRHGYRNLLEYQRFPSNAYQVRRLKAGRMN